MCYRCTVCDHVTRHGESMRRYTFYRTVPGVGYTISGQRKERQEIAGEVPICWQCDDELQRGTVWNELLKEHRRLPTPMPNVSHGTERMVGHELPRQGSLR